MPTMDKFADGVRDLLGHLYDYDYLQKHAFTTQLQEDGVLSEHERMRLLRSVILQTIDEMAPDSTGPVRAPRTRAYQVLNLHYVEGLTIQEISRELAVSERQVYRDLRKAERDLAVLLRPKLAPEAASEERSSASRSELVLEEAQRLGQRREWVEIEPLLDGALLAVRRLAQENAVDIDLRLDIRSPRLYTDRQLLRQAILSLLSHAIQNAESTLIFAATLSDGALTIRAGFNVREGVVAPGELPDFIQGLAHSLGGTCTQTIEAERWLTLDLSLADSGRRSLLVIDDNAGLIELFERYLADQPYRLMGASEGKQGLEIAERERPAVIFLDVMMPQQDGWEVLQRLQNQAATRDIPVVVCSVLDDPELAYSLGATGFLAKPVSRLQLLEALSRCVAENSAR